MEVWYNQDCGKTVRQQYMELANHPAHEVWYGKFDSSVRFGVEHVSYPVSIERWRTMRDLEWMTQAQEMGMAADKNPCTGMHVHFPKSTFTRIEVFKMYTFLYKHNDFLRRISQRLSPHWAGFDCMPNLEWRHRIARGQRGSKGCPLGSSQRATFEWRTFHSTLQPKMALARLNFLTALIGWIRYASLAELTLGHFKWWLFSKHSIPYLPGKHLDTVMEILDLEEQDNPILPSASGRIAGSLEGIFRRTYAPRMSEYYISTATAITANTSTLGDAL
jgi:hypothetical protein